MKEFRSYLLDRFPQLKEVRRSSTDLHILVAIKGAGHYIGIDYSFVQEPLCDFVKRSVDEISLTSSSGDEVPFESIVVDCFKPQYVDFLTEHTIAREAHIIISADGTVSFVSLLAQVLK